MKSAQITRRPEKTPVLRASRSRQTLSALSEKVHALDTLQRMADNSTTVQRGAALQRQGDAANPKHSGPPDQLKAGIEGLTSIPRDDVRVHRNSDKPAALDADAFAQGRDIHLGPGQEKNLPHEAWYMVEQAQGRVKPGAQIKGIAINDDVGLEAEADRMGAIVQDAAPAQRQSVASSSTNSSQEAVIQGEFDQKMLWGLAAAAGVSLITVTSLLATYGRTGTWIWLNAKLRLTALNTPIADLVTIWNQFGELDVATLVTLGSIGVTPAQAADMRGRLGSFTDVGEGFMTTYNMVANDYKVPPGQPNAVALNQAIDRWTQEGFGTGQNDPADIQALNEIYGINGVADAREHKGALLHAYSKLAGSQTAIGRQLATKLAHSGTYPINITAPDGQVHQKQVELKLIVRPGIPGQFLSPFEQGMDLAQCIGANAPIPAVIMWDPTLQFEYFRPAEGSEGKAENDSTRRGVRENMPAWVVLAHELGHFTDFLERPNDFSDKLNEADIDAIEGWNLPRERTIVEQDLGKTPRDYYQDFPGGKNQAKIDR